ncbi:MAG: DNA polymerase III subunit beta [Lentimicrobiaceae bacterium]|jgi:DNA polymerase-3 subunit beta|nr:DNA polymerase III subunit beta [Lentimicrobiaceae bacterium]
MKIILSSLKLLKSLQALSGVINSNNTLPILDDFLFSLTREELKITASDLETTMTISLTPDMAEGTGEVTIPARILLDIMKTFPDIPITLNINDDTLAVELIASEGRYKLAGHKSDEFPKAVTIENDAMEVLISAEVLASGFEKTIFATGTDELRPVMSGVLLEMSENNITFVATDAHKLVRYRRTDAKAAHSASFVLPKKPINQLKNLLSAKEEQVKLTFNQTNASFEFDNFKLISRLIEGRFPNYEAVIPTSNPNILTIDRLSLLNAIRRVSIFSSKATHQVRFKITGQELVLSAEDLDYYNEAKERLACSYIGDDMEIGFNSRFFFEILSNLPTEEVCLEMSSSNRAGIVSPIENLNADEHILMLLMPVMLN